MVAARLVTDVRPLSPGSLSSSDASPSSQDSHDDESDGPEVTYIGHDSSDLPRKRRKLSPTTLETHVPVQVASRIASSKSATEPAPQPQSGLPSREDATSKLARGGFASLSVQPWLVTSLASMAITRPTGIQSACIPKILEGRDCIGGSRTGSGKTVAFAVPILQQWAIDPIGIFAVVLTPTRELALQIFEQFKAISAPQPLKPILVTGGSEMREQALGLSRRPHVVIATPGRLADHIRTSGEDTICGLRRAKVVVLDEADRLLKSGDGSMLPDVEDCLAVLPPSQSRQTLLFTATVTPEVRALKELPRSSGRPELFICEVDTEVLAIPPTLQQRYLQTPVTHRECFLHVLLLTPVNVERSIIIFCNRTSTADFLTHLLRLLEHRVTALHSALRQRQRIDNLGRFRASAARILVATDVAARGLDIPEVALIINYDVPRDPDDYIHRVGRTARAGRKGEAVTLIGQRDVQLILAIEERVGKKMTEFQEEGVSVEGRVIRDALKIVGEMKREAALEIEEGKEVGGKRKKGMTSLKKKGMR
ncbi:MAG: putative RNA helicase [Piccolia ochrophora]|nr:MAG: putative RNA helicase [Piccolia ochrophora]